MSKRVFDLMAIVLTSPIWVPVLLATTLLLLLCEGRPIFYFSTRRVGARTSMRIAKFRTMVRNAESFYNREMVPVTRQRFLNTPIDSPLYTRVGRWIERCQFTELPQIFHVMSGQMTIIGNRPLPKNVIESLREIHPNVDDRFDTPAGLTGITQLIGREDISDASRLLLEGQYCRAAASKYSVQLDILILVLTICIVLRLIRPRSLEQAHALINRFNPLTSPSTGTQETSQTSSSVERDIA